MAVALQVKFIGSPSADDVHRFRNFGEDLARTLVGIGEVTLREVDQARTHFIIREIKPRGLGTVTKEVNRQARLHHLAEQVAVLRAA